MRERNIGWRLDYVLASEPLAKQRVSCPSQREIGTSDHAPVVATFQLSSGRSCQARRREDLSAHCETSLRS